MPPIATFSIPKSGVASRYCHVQRGLTILMRSAVVAGGSLASRAASFALLVYSARALPLPDFGKFAIGIAVAVGIANILAVGVGDMLAGVAVTSPMRLRKLVRVGTVVSVLATALSAALLITPTVATLAGCGLVVVTGSVLSMFAMQMSRARSAISAGMLGYYVPAAARLIPILLLPSRIDLQAISLAVAATTILPACCAMLWMQVVIAKSAMCDGGQQEIKRTSLPAALVIGWSYFVMNQCDIVALTVFVSVESSAQFVPQMRIYEALGAFAIAVKVVFTREAFLDPRASPWRPARLAAALYALFALPTIFLGVYAAQYMLGFDARWDILTATLLSVTYLFATIATFLVQSAVAQMNWSSVYRGSIAMHLVALAGMPPLALSLGTVGVAIGDLLIFGVWNLGILIGLRRERGNNESPNRYCPTASAIWRRREAVRRAAESLGEKRA